ncbi:hypothetical protein PHAVU_007G048100 [Phaseolus vulgaris]
MESQSEGSSSTLHAVIFSFMSIGHTLPLLNFARLLLRRNVAVTVFTTHANCLFISHNLYTAAAVIDLPFPSSVPEIPVGVESTDKLPSTSLFHAFATSTSLIKPHFELALQLLPPVSFMVSDIFLWWTLDSASKFGFHRFVFDGMSNYSHALIQEAFRIGLLSGPLHPEELVPLTRFPGIRVSKNDFDPAFQDKDPHSLFNVFLNKVHTAIFYELEPVFVDYMNAEIPLRSWCVGPLCLACPEKKTPEKSVWVQWLDHRLEEKRSVLYVAFGSQAEVSSEQLVEIAKGLEQSTVNFMWVLKGDEQELPSGFEERVKGRGMLVREWVDQREILMHESVEGFVSHCGWKSVLESVCAGVPILAWPLCAEQFENARMVEEEIKVGLRVETSDGSVRGFVKGEALRKTVRAVMEGEEGKEVRRKVMKLGEMAHKALEEGGSSQSSLDFPAS